MKKILGITLLVFIVGLPIAAFAQEQGFVPLTDIQNVKFAGNAAELPAFLNSIYMICIGLAAVIGVLQIMRAGVVWMTAGGSHEGISNAKGLIRDTIIGLILVLAPTIVFSIINPDILSLQIRGLPDLKTDNKPAGQSNPSDTYLWSDTSSSRDAARARCTAQGGEAVFTCTPEGGTTRTVPAGEACAAGEDGRTYCKKTDKIGEKMGACGDYTRISTISAGGLCDGSKGFTQLSAQCCNNASGVCCGAKYSIEKPPKALGCSVAYGNKADLKFDQTAELCCNKQDAEGIQCEALKNSEGGMTAGLYCSCSYTK